MTPQQYELLTELFHAALEIAPDERAAFLEMISDGDADLRRELESLLAAHEQGAFTERPPEDIAAGLYLARQKDNADAGAASLAPNTRLDHYEIRSLLGKGGMGEVYPAEDVRLRRKVALKILPAAVASNRDRMRRFEQEATAAAALNHPHIAHVYEIGESESTHYIAIEHIDGDTLRDKIHRDKAPLQKLLKYLTQVAEGLTKAHAAGIVHRDLKPDNIMVTRDDYAKILDFGLAKLIEPQGPVNSRGAASAEVVTAVTAQHSSAGMIVGTAGYMSPEQAQGRVKEIDHRSDIFSFGCILFEAATGRKAFEGRDTLDSLHKIVHAPTPQIKETNADAPDELQRIVRRCLAKDPERRYQSSKDVAIELEELRQKLDAESEPQPPLQPVSVSGATPSGDAGAGVPSDSQPAVSTAEVRRSRPTTSAEYIVKEIERHKTGAAFIIAALTVAVAGITYGLYKFVGHKAATSLPSMKMTKPTNSGKVGTGRETKFASISPTGN
jgi:serine/threonine protein kinase